MKAKDLRNLSDEELIAKEKSLHEELYKLNLARYGARVDKPHQFRAVRKDIARIETIRTGRKGTKNG
jgi:large subunit ribosomal protein L29